MITLELSLRAFPN